MQEITYTNGNPILRVKPVSDYAEAETRLRNHDATLLLELHPSALVDAALDDLLCQLAESITGRARVPVGVEVEGECALPPPLYPGRGRFRRITEGNQLLKVYGKSPGFICCL